VGNCGKLWESLTQYKHRRKEGRRNNGTPEINRAPTINEQRNKQSSRRNGSSSRAAGKKLKQLEQKKLK
tara:strand:- start:13 stop:219 length:207 start_codon:yes stop_codon:yes gene_type:complete